MKLKTLKDMKKWKAKHGVRDDQPYVFYTQLRKEAIKWVKDSLPKTNATINEIKKDGSIVWQKEGEVDIYFVGRVTALVEFHNITEEDLR